MHRDLVRFKPHVVVIDPISALRGPAVEVQSTLLRMVDLLKSRGITAVFTSLQNDGGLTDGADPALSSLMDTWIKLVDMEANGEMNRVLYVIKSRGMSHSNQFREYRMTNAGVEIIAPYIGPEGVLTGTARVTQVARKYAAQLRRRQDAEQRQNELHRRRGVMESQIAEMRGALEAQEQEASRLLAEDDAREVALETDRAAVAARRGDTE
jgi:circadian clock protein KaiC